MTIDKESFFFRVRKLLSGSAASCTVIIIAIIARIIQLIFFYNIRVDASYQIMATDNFIHGHGISLGAVNPNDLSEVIYKPLVFWPPGYSLLLSPFYLAFNCNYIAAGLALDMLMAIVLIITCRKILRLLDVQEHLINLFTLVNGFFIYYFYFIASSDAIAIAFFVLALYYSLRLIKQKGSAAKNIGLLSFFLFVSSLIKYLFTPVVFVVPLFLLFTGYMSKISAIKKGGLVSFLLLLLAIGSLLLYQIKLSGSAGHVSSQGRGFFPEHLLDTYPFVPASFISPDTVGILLNQPVTHASFFYIFLQVANVLLILFITGYFFYALRKQKLKSRPASASFFLLSFFLSAAVFIVLAILSLKVSKEEILPGFLWTYVEEARYYGLVYVLFHLAVFVFYKGGLQKVSRYTRVLFYLFVVLLSLETLRGVFFDLNRVVKFNEEEYSWQYEHRIQKQAHLAIQKIKATYPSVPVIVTGSTYYYNHRVSLYSHVPVLYQPEVLFKDSISHTSKPVVALYIQYNHDGEKQLPNLPHRSEKIGDYENFSFYMVPVSLQ